jgi:hypothetical protein
MADQCSVEDVAKTWMRIGMNTAVLMMRDGNLRLDPLPFERGAHPYERTIRPWKATRLIWRSWWRERRGR